MPIDELSPAQPHPFHNIYLVYMHCHMACVSVGWPSWLGMWDVEDVGEVQVCSVVVVTCCNVVCVAS